MATKTKAKSNKIKVGKNMNSMYKLILKVVAVIALLIIALYIYLIATR